MSFVALNRQHRQWIIVQNNNISKVMAKFRVDFCEADFFHNFWEKRHLTQISFIQFLFTRDQSFAQKVCFFKVFLWCVRRAVWNVNQKLAEVFFLQNHLIKQKRCQNIHFPLRCDKGYGQSVKRQELCCLIWLTKWHKLSFRISWKGTEIDFPYSWHVERV